MKKTVLFFFLISACSLEFIEFRSQKDCMLDEAILILEKSVDTDFIKNAALNVVSAYNCSQEYETWAMEWVVSVKQMLKTEQGWCAEVYTGWPTGSICLYIDPGTHPEHFNYYLTHPGDFYTLKITPMNL